ncbi:Beige/BEACH domain-containing protein, partial [Cardiosporidium cionae]
MFAAVRLFNLLLMEEGEQYVTDCSTVMMTSHPQAIPFPLSFDERGSSGFPLPLTKSSIKSAMPTFESGKVFGTRNLISQNAPFNKSVPLLPFSIPDALVPHLLLKPSKGWLRIGSKSLIFEPDSIWAPMIKLPFTHIVDVHIHRTASQPPTLVILCKQVANIPTDLYDGKTRCVMPFVIDVANSQPLSANMLSEQSIGAPLAASFGTSSRPTSVSSRIPLYTFPGLPASRLASNSSVSYPLESSESSSVDTAVALPHQMLYAFTFQLQPHAYSAETSKGILPSMRLSTRLNTESLISSARTLFHHENLTSSTLSTAGYTLANSAEYIASLCVDLWKLSTNQMENPSNVPKALLRADYVNSVLDTLTQSLVFDLSQLDLHEQILLPSNTGIWVHRIKPLLRHKGLLQISSECIYFQPYPNFSTKPSKHIPLSSILHIFKRVSASKPTTLEIIATSISQKGRNYRALLIEFPDFTSREAVAAVLHSQLKRAFRVQHSREFLVGMMTLWQKGKISNFHYLDFLNCLAGRSRCDFSHYPIFPWTLSDFTSSKLNLDDPNVFRDLSKPIGAITPQRLDYLVDRMKDSQLPKERTEVEQGIMDGGSPLESIFLYGSHYSNPAYVVFWLVRKYPECQLRLHSGRFDAFSRMYHSIQNAYKVASMGQSTFIELIPDFYETSTDFLLNRLNVKATEAPLNDVELPPWAKGSAEFFLNTMRQALETDFVSRYLPDWIDLIFGFKQQGEEALDAHNLFHPLTYVDSSIAVSSQSCPIGISKPLNETVKRLISTMSDSALTAQLQEFGQTPIQLFNSPHPRRINCPKWQSPSWEGDPWRDSP